MRTQRFVSNSSKFNGIFRSFSELNFRREAPPEDQTQEKILEKEFESIAEEPSIQKIQSPVVKRDKSVDIKINEYDINNNYKNRISQLEFDLANIRKEYLRITDQKIKIEKELAAIKKKNKYLEEQLKEDYTKINSYETIIKKYKKLEKQFSDSNQIISDLNKKLKETHEKVNLENQEKIKIQEMLEDIIESIKKENLIYKTELVYKDEYCESLKQDIEALKSLSKDHYQNKAVKNLSYIILSKDSGKSFDPFIKLKELEKDYDSLSAEHNIYLAKYQKLIEWIKSLIRMIKVHNYDGAQSYINKIEIFSDFNALCNSKPSTDSSTPVCEGNESEIKELNHTISTLKETIESLEIKLELYTQSSGQKDFLSYMVCQAAIIEDYLNEDIEISQINSSMFSF